MKLQLGPESVSRKQIRGVLMLGLFSMSPNQIPAQSPASPKSPMEVLQAYRKMDLEVDHERLV
jgi:hypothetical protein